MKIDRMSNDFHDVPIENQESMVNQFNPDMKINEFKNIKYNQDVNFDPDIRKEFLTIDDCVNKFDELTWNTLDCYEMNDAIIDLKDTIALDLELENIPEIDYYFNENVYDFGFYSSNENKIYINCLQLDHPKNIVKTIAHELRHCWQTEQINLPKELQNDFTKVLKFNDKNYIDPYDNYEAYWNQPMEVDARLYSEHILSNINESVGI